MCYQLPVDTDLKYYVKGGMRCGVVCLTSNDVVPDYLTVVFQLIRIILQCTSSSIGKVMVTIIHIFKYRELLGHSVVHR